MAAWVLVLTVVTANHIREFEIPNMLVTLDQCLADLKFYQPKFKPKNAQFYMRCDPV